MSAIQNALDLEQLSFRPIQADDQPFLQVLYASTRWAELEVTGWSDEEKTAFLLHQFQLQHHHYQNHYQGAQFDLILFAGHPIGRLYLFINSSEYRIVDIALMPEARGRGLGTYLLNKVIDQAKADNKPVTIHVERENPAMTLYQRLGFAKVEEVGVYFLMALRP